MPASPNPTDRVLDIFEYLVTRGPQPLEALTKSLGMSRTATWRHLDTLRRRGWVRLRDGDKAYIVTHAGAAVFKSPIASTAEADRVSQIRENWTPPVPTRIEVAAIVGPGEVQVIEGGNDPLPHTLPALISPLALCCAATLPKASLVQHLEAAFPNASLESQYALEEGEVFKQIQNIKTRGFALEFEAISLPLSWSSAQNLAVRLAVPERFSNPAALRKVASSFVLQMENWLHSH